jgi:hypothetical protein
MMNIRTSCYTIYESLALTEVKFETIFINLLWGECSIRFNYAATYQTNDNRIYRVILNCVKYIKIMLYSENEFKHMVAIVSLTTTESIRKSNETIDIVCYERIYFSHITVTAS